MSRSRSSEANDVITAVMLALAKAARAFADTLEAELEGTPANPPAPRKPTKKKPRKRAPAPPPIPPGFEPTELDRARARAALRRVGYIVKEPDQ